MIYNIIGLIIWSVIAIVWGKIHAKIITDQKRNPGGAPDYFLRAFVAWVVIFAQEILRYPVYTPYIDVWRQFIGLNVIYCGWFWLVFDLAINFFRGNELYYVSSTNGKLADSFFYRHFYYPFLVQLFTKIVVIVAGILIFASGT